MRRRKPLLCAAAVVAAAVVVLTACGDERAAESDPVETTRPERSCVAVLQLGSLTPDIDAVFRELPAVQLGGAPATDGSGIAFYQGDTPVVSLDRAPLSQSVIDHDLALLSEWAAARQAQGVSLDTNPTEKQCSEPG